MMRNIVLVLLIVGVAFFVSGCFETKENYTLNPDSSGKVVYEALFQPLSINITGEEVDPESQMKDAVRKTLEDSLGVDVWKDVSFKLANDGRISFKGTAYFKDISKLKLKVGGGEMKGMKPVFTKDAGGGMVLELKNEKKEKSEADKKKTAKLSDEEIAKKIKVEKAKYQQMKPMMESFMSTMKMDMSFRLPGTLKKVTNFKRENGILQFTFEGKKLFEVMNQMFEDETWMREQVIAGADLTEGGPTMNFVMNEKLFGEKAPIRAVVTGKLKPLFNYTSEVTAAKKDYKMLLKGLGVTAAIPTAAPAKGGSFKSLKVGGVRIITISDQKRDIRPFNYDSGYTLSLIGELPGAVLKVTEGELKEATADNGDSLLPEHEWDRKIHFPRLSKNKTTVVFETKLTLPKENVKAIKKLSGILEYNVAVDSKEVDLGFTHLIAGIKGKEFDAVIKSIKESKWQKGSQTLSLKMNLSNDAVKSMSFYDEGGKKLDISSSGHSGFGGFTTFEYTCKGKFPKKGKIVVKIFENLEKYKIPFEMENISLLGQSLN